MRFEEGQVEIPDEDILGFIGKLWEAIPTPKREKIYGGLAPSEMELLRVSSPDTVSPEIDHTIKKFGHPERFRFTEKQLGIGIEDLGFSVEIESSILGGRSSEYLPTIHTLHDLISTPAWEIGRLRRLGPGRIRQIATRLHELENNLNS